MIRQSTLWGLAGLCALAAVGGCSSDSADAAAQNRSDVVRRYVGQLNSPLMNGREPNGTQTNGRLANGRLANGRLANGRLANGRLANGTVVQGAEEENDWVLESVDVDSGVTFAGAGLVGMELDGKLTNGTTQRVRIDGFSDTQVPGMQVYRVVFVATGQSICGEKDGQPIWASILPQRFDMSTGAQLADEPNEYTFSCRFGALQKCQEYGYPKNQKRWEDLDGQPSRRRRLTDYHAACVRMVRADYCGDGVPHTFDGTTIDIYDHLRSGNTPATSPTNSDGLGFYREAEWEADGAHCIEKTRWMNNGLSGLTGTSSNNSLSNDDWAYIYNNCPNRFATTVRPGFPPDRQCGTNSKWNTTVGFETFDDDAPVQATRGKIRNHSMLNVHIP